MNTELERSMESAGELKEQAHVENVPMTPIIEMIRDEEVIGIIGMAGFDTYDEKVTAFTQCLFAVRSMRCDALRLLIDAHMSKVEPDSYHSDDFVAPSKDPEAVDVILGYEWKDGQPVEAVYHEYHYLDNGTLEWKGIEPFPQNAVESWMNDRVAWAYRNDMPIENDVMALGEFMSSKGHVLALMKGETDGSR